MNEIEIRGFLETEISEKEMTEKERKTLDDLAGQLNDLAIKFSNNRRKLPSRL